MEYITKIKDAKLEKKTRLFRYSDFYSISQQKTEVGIDNKQYYCGFARIHIVLLALCAALLIAVLVPAYKAYKYHGQWLACAESLRVVNGAFIVDLLDNGEAFSLNEASENVVAILPGREGYCPVGGNIYFIKEKQGEWKAVCGMHDSDHMERTRLNASYVLNRIREKVREEQVKGNRFPEEVTVVLNSSELVCKLVSEETGIRRGTNTTKGYEGTVAFYGIAGYGSFKAKNSGISTDANAWNSQTKTTVSKDGAVEGDICYFCFANEEYNADWRADDGWSGRSYGDTY